MRRAAFTLIEVVLSLALLGILAVAAVSWTAGAIRVQAATLETSEHARQIQTLERLIRVDLFSADATLAPALRREERVWVQLGNLHILARDHGAAEMIYSHDAGRAAVIRAVRPLDGGRDWSESVVINNVDGFLPSIESTQNQQWSDVCIALSMGGYNARMLAFIVPAEWTP